MRFVILIFAMLCLVGCAVSPHTLGISNKQWDQYSEAQQQNLVANYEQIQASDLNANIDYNNFLVVGIKGGTAMMPPFTASYRYNPVKFTIPAGTCEIVTLHSVIGVSSVDLTACFKNKVLYMDPSRYELNKKLGSIKFHALPLWNNGFSYHNISSSGYTRLRNVTVTIKQVFRHNND